MVAVIPDELLHSLDKPLRSLEEREMIREEIHSEVLGGLLRLVISVRSLI